MVLPIHCPVMIEVADEESEDARNSIKLRVSVVICDGWNSCDAEKRSLIMLIETYILTVSVGFRCIKSARRCCLRGKSWFMM